MIRTALAALSAAALVSMTVPAAAQATLRCNSSPGSYNYCVADTRPGVYLVRQHDRYPCYEGDTWGYDSGGIWVANGCKATFQLGRYTPPPRPRPDSSGDEGAAIAALLALGIIGAIASGADDGGSYTPPPPPRPGGGWRPRLIVCESQNYRYARCAVPVRSHVELYRQWSSGRGQCRYGQSWGYDARGVWVNNGCRAEFAIH